ncbi:thiamine-phosphate kinase [Brevibacillus migulae]|uniref:thiamine-phosphate kinase n=1 Tax=Brevibacillus migulae TaxID=1644114 RepID=UPI00106E655F|nr:thiamine-phosphate kinase [Brevibacillus migulae]
MALDEFSRIRKWTSRSATDKGGDGLSIGIGDDAAVFGVASGMEVVACCDAMIETVHFLRRTMKPADIGYKALVSNLSDVAAMGGIPKYAMVTIGVSPTWTEEDCELVYEGIYEAAEAYGVRIIGGDTVSTPDALHLSISVLGEVERGKAIRRSGAMPGDLIFVTGNVGGSAAGLHLLLSAEEAGQRDEAAFREWAELIRKHRRPVPRIQEGRLLLTGCLRPGALNDVSDGLASELWEIAEASSALLVVEESIIPIADVTRQYALHAGKSALDWGLYGGEDYELVGTVAAGEAERMEQLFREHDCTFRVIGRVEAGEPAVWLTDAQDRKRPLPKGGYNHFSR